MDKPYMHASEYEISLLQCERKYEKATYYMI